MILRGLVLAGAFALGTAFALAPAPDGGDDDAPVCCKTCRKGKACGDSCIARSKTCDKPKGCACDAEAE